jgi:hypothetical protein
VCRRAGAGRPARAPRAGAATAGEEAPRDHPPRPRAPGPSDCPRRAPWVGLPQSRNARCPSRPEHH